mmetsp:Transcript_36077/g.144237  ORF Transcript_36077/g.144237 Transcript_36077/m.144237 type:complete len:81 (+) Transcript_36077:1064-1306(+)
MSELGSGRAKDGEQVCPTRMKLFQNRALKRSGFWLPSFALATKFRGFSSGSFGLPVESLNSMKRLVGKTHRLQIPIQDWE